MTKVLLNVFVCAGLVFSAFGCEEEDTREKQPASDTQVAALQAAVTDLGTVSDVAADSTTAGTANTTLSNLYANYNNLVTDVTTSQQAQGLTPYAETTVNCTTGSYTWDDTGSVTYNSCDGLDGFINWSGDTFTIDITYDFGAMYGGMYSGQMTYAGEITITDTSIDGALDLAYQFDMDSGYGAVSYDSEYSIKYESIGLDAEGCPESGAMDLEGSYAYSASGQDYSQDFHITATFNACGDVTMAY